MPGWATDMVGVFLGAVLGALFGFGFSRWQAREEAQARRSTLFRTLSDQMWMITTEDVPYDQGRLDTRSTIHVSAAGELLRGDTLDARKDATLIRRLIIWQSFEASHNEKVRITNQANVTVSIPQEHRAAWQESLNESKTLLTVLRLDVLSGLPVEYQTPSWPHDPAKDEGLLFAYPVDQPPDATQA